MESTAETLSHKIHSLDPDQLLQVEHLIESLQAHDRYRAALSLSEPAFAGIWNNPEDDAYDAL